QVALTGGSGGFRVVLGLLRGGVVVVGGGGGVVVPVPAGCQHARGGGDGGNPTGGHGRPRAKRGGAHGAPLVEWATTASPGALNVEAEAAEHKGPAGPARRSFPHRYPNVRAGRGPSRVSGRPRASSGPRPRSRPGARTAPPHHPSRSAAASPPAPAPPVPPRARARRAPGAASARPGPAPAAHARCAAWRP